MDELDKLFQQLAIETQKSVSLGETHINLTAERGFQLKDVALFEEKAEMIENDKDGNPTDKTYFAPLISLNIGKDLQLSEAECKAFLPFWNLKTKIDMQKIGLIYAIDNLQYPQKSLETGGK